MKNPRKPTKNPKELQARIYKVFDTLEIDQRLTIQEIGQKLGFTDNYVSSMKHGHALRRGVIHPAPYLSTALSTAGVAKHCSAG